MKQNDPREWFTVDDIAALDSPSLLFYQERIEGNIRSAIQQVRNVGLLRPHVKTNKSADICRLMMKAGITKFKCATIAEAEMLGGINAADALLAYQPAGPKIYRLMDLVKRYPKTRFSCLVDNRVSAQKIGTAFQSEGLSLDVSLDLNVGQNRTGIVPEKAFELFTALRSIPGITAVSLHAYDGHVTTSDREEREKRCNDAFSGVFRLQKQIVDAFGISLVIVAGGSPTFSIHAHRGTVECSPGTFVLWDQSYADSYPGEPYQCAALVATRIVSIVDDKTLCIDLGHKSVASENPLPRVTFLNVPDALPVGHSEEHMTVKVPDANRYSIGDVFYGVPTHICPTVSMYERATVINGHSISVEWKITARDKKLTI